MWDFFLWVLQRAHRRLQFAVYGVDKRTAEEAGLAAEASKMMMFASDTDARKWAQQKNSKKKVNWMSSAVSDLLTRAHAIG